MNPLSLIFLHGFPFNATAWQPQVKFIEQKFENRVQAFAPDLRGHGTAAAGESPPGPWMISHYVTDLLKFMDERGIKKAVLCGLSMGGYIALQFVAKHPGRVAGLILSDTRADADSNEAKEKRFEMIERLHREGLAGVATDFSKTVLSDSTLRGQPELLTRVRQMIMTNDAANMALVVGALASRSDSRATLPSVRCPTMVIVGADDKVTPPELSELIAGGIEDADLNVIEKAGHLSNLERPDVFNEFIAEFLTNNFTMQAEAATAI